MREVENRCCYSSLLLMRAKAAGSCFTFLGVGPLYYLTFVLIKSSKRRANTPAAEWIQSSTEYHYDSPSLSFHQSTLASNLLQTLLSVNEQALSSLTAPTAIGSSKQGATLAEVCQAGIKTSAQSGASSTSVEVLNGVMDALAGQKEVPVFLAIDEVQALFSRSEVRTPDYKVLESYHLSTPKMALDYVTGKKSFVGHHPRP